MIYCTVGCTWLNVIYVSQIILILEKLAPTRQKLFAETRTDVGLQSETDLMHDADLMHNGERNAVNLTERTFNANDVDLFSGIDGKPVVNDGRGIASNDSNHQLKSVLI